MIDTFFSDTFTSCLPDVTDKTGCTEIVKDGIKLRGCVCNTDLCNGSGGSGGGGGRGQGDKGKSYMYLSARRLYNFFHAQTI